MVADDTLREGLLDVLLELEKRGLSLLLGGGYGLYLKQLHLQETAHQFLIDAHLWPPPRSTQDLDLLLPTEIVADPQKMGAVREVLDRLGYGPAEEAKYMKFRKDLGSGKSLEIDLLTGPIDTAPEGAVKVSGPRVKPSSKVRLHARKAFDALGLDQRVSSFLVEGSVSDGSPCRVEVRVPHPFTFMLMKLHAFRDRKEDDSKDLARHHALDLLRIVAMLTEEEYEEVRSMVHHFRDDEVLRSARRIVNEEFSSMSDVGIIRMIEYSRAQGFEIGSPSVKETPIQEFMDALGEIFADQR